MNMLPTALDRTLVTTVFQPVIDLDDDRVAGYEALSRGPAGPLAAPTALLDAARRAGRLAEIDWLCREAAVDAARGAGVRAPLSLLINAEPETLFGAGDDIARWGAFADLRCYCEITERALTQTPGRLVAAIDQIRAQDWGVALDDVGADPASLALLPLLQPDLIKLDLRLLHDAPANPQDVRVARVIDAALAQAEVTGAAVVAEGVETEWHLDLARAYGVHYAQGFYLGRPGPLPAELPTPRRSMPLVPRVDARTVAPGPFSIVATNRPVRRLSADAVNELVRQLLAQARSLSPAPAVLICSPAPLRDDLLRLVSEPAEVPFVGLLGAAQGTLPVSSLSAGDPAGSDFAVAVVTAHFAAAVAARPNAAVPDQYDAALVLDREIAVAVASVLLARL